jgi:hypothetical protein
MSGFRSKKIGSQVMYVTVAATVSVSSLSGLTA